MRMTAHQPVAAQTTTQGAELLQASSSAADSPPTSGKSRTVGTPAFSVDQSEARIAWVSQASCRGIDPDQLFVRGAAQRKAATICRHCPVLMQCAADALDNRVEFGVWGGMTERQRRALLKQHPEVESWSEFFEHQRARQHAV